MKLDRLSPYRIRNITDLRNHCDQQNALVGKLRTAKDGLVIHHRDCDYVQNKITEFSVWPVFGTNAQDFAAFQQLALSASVPIQLHFSCQDPQRQQQLMALGLI